MRKNYIFTSESVSEGHPDKICDQISDAILDAHIRLDPEARVACETFATTNRVVVGGETRLGNGKKISDAEIEQIVRDTVKEIGYEQDGFHWKNLEVTNLIHAQSDEIAVGVDASGAKEEGAGDQGLMFGYACNEALEYMPAAIYYSHRILNSILDDIKAGKLPELRPDAKTQVTLEYVDGKPVKANTVLISIQHTREASISRVAEIVKPYIKRALPDGWFTEDTRFLVNPTGVFVIGGPDGDAGLTGRKIIVDTYGGYAPHGGGAFSGKDATKVDRSAAYIARYMAKNVVAAGLAEKCLIQVSYAIGIAEPTSFYVDTLDTGKVHGSKIEELLRDLVDLTPKGIRTLLGLNKPIFKRTAAYGHFGRKPDADGGFSWERTDLAETLKKNLL